MTMFFNHLHVFWQLLVRSFVIFKPELKDKIINCLIWSTITTVIFAFFVSVKGIDNYGTFILMSSAATWGLFSTIMNVATVIGDLSGDKTIFYELSLPLPQWMVFAKIGIVNGLTAFIIALLVVPVGKLCLWNSVDFTYFLPFKFYLLVLLACLFYGFFSLLIASSTKNLYKLDNVWLRVIFPMWFLGCYQFSWITLYDLSPTIAYINLLNPLTYAMEGARAASLDPSLSLPYWNCIAGLCFFILLSACVGIHKMKKRLDCL